MKPLQRLVCGDLTMFVVALLLGVGYLPSCLPETARVAQEELASKADIVQYEWFRSFTASMQKRKMLLDKYSAIPETEWPQSRKMTYAGFQAELVELKSDYDDLVVLYNARSFQFDWAPFQGGDVPHLLHIYDYAEN